MSKKVEFTITGRVPSKKNGKRILQNRKTGKPFIAQSKKAKAWEKQHERELKELMKVEDVEFPIKKCKALFTYYPNTKHSFDLHNKSETIFDVLEKSGFIESDSFKTITESTNRFGGYTDGDFRVEVVIDIL